MKVKEKLQSTNATAARIRELNDNFRRTFEGGRIVLTSSVAQLPDDQRQRILAAIKAFADFDEGNDPHHEHDFVSVEVDGIEVFWKCDYYDLDIRYGADDASDPDRTVRVATIMRSDEY